MEATMKKTLFLSATALILLLSACSGEKEEKAQEAATSEQSENKQEEATTVTEQKTTEVSEPAETTSEQTTETSEIRATEYDESLILKEGYSFFAEPDGTILMQYPSHWDADAYYKDTYDATYSFEVPELPREKRQSTFKIVESENVYKSLEEFVEKEFKPRHGGINKAEILEDKIIQIDGQDAIYKRYKYRLNMAAYGKVEFHEVNVFVQAGDYAYEIKTTAIDQLAEKYLPDFNQMLETLEFKQLHTTL
jgi:hypothetical protein